MLLLATMTLATLLTPPGSDSIGPIQGGEYMTSSWYGDESGKTRADGHPYDKMEMVVAHKTYPFGTKLLLINPTTGKQVIVTVRDRGPFVRGRDLDCSEGVANKLGFRRKGIQELLTIRLNYIPLHSPTHSRLQLVQAKTSGKTYARSSIPKFLAKPTQTRRNVTSTPFYCVDYLPLEFRRGTLVK